MKSLRKFNELCTMAHFTSISDTLTLRRIQILAKLHKRAVLLCHPASLRGTAPMSPTDRAFSPSALGQSDLASSVFGPGLVHDAPKDGMEVTQWTVRIVPTIISSAGPTGGPVRADGWQHHPGRKDLFAAFREDFPPGEHAPGRLRWHCTISIQIALSPKSLAPKNATTSI